MVLVFNVVPPEGSKVMMIPALYLTFTALIYLDSLNLLIRLWTVDCEISKFYTLPHTHKWYSFYIQTSSSGCMCTRCCWAYLNFPGLLFLLSQLLWEQIQKETEQQRMHFQFKYLVFVQFSIEYMSKNYHILFFSVLHSSCTLSPKSWCVFLITPFSYLQVPEVERTLYQAPHGFLTSHSVRDIKNWCF